MTSTQARPLTPSKLNSDVMIRAGMTVEHYLAQFRRVELQLATLPHPLPEPDPEIQRLVRPMKPTEVNQRPRALVQGGAQPVVPITMMRVVRQRRDGRERY